MNKEQLRQALKAGIITQSVFNEEVAKIDAAEAAEAAVDDTFFIDPETFLANAINEMKGKSVAEKKRIGKTLSMEATLLQEGANLSNNRFEAKQWGSLSWKLRTLRV